MIDTVSIRRKIPLLPPAEMSARGFTTECGHAPSDCEYIKWICHLPNGSKTWPHLTWSSTPSGPWLTVAVSLPKFVYNNNVLMVSENDVTLGLDEISRFVTEKIGAPFDAHTGIVGRIDYCWNFPVREGNIIPYISAASHASIPRMTPYRIGTTTIAFKNKSKEIVLYGKHEEVARRALQGKATDEELRNSVGLLRVEIRHTRSDSCKRLAKKYGLPDRHAGLLLAGNVAHNEIAQALEVLDLDKTAETIDSRLDVLREFYGDTHQCRGLVAFLGFLDRYGEHFWKNGIGGYSRSTYYDCVRALKKAGVWLKADKQLRPLRLVQPLTASVQVA